MLGPKQGLLLVDVAGEMVLLGTTDKGVQLLTKLEGNGIERTTEESSVTSEQPSTARTDEVENPFGKMLGQFRQASEKLKSATANVGRQVGATNGTNSELNLLVTKTRMTVVISSRSHLERQCRHTRGRLLCRGVTPSSRNFECSRVLKS